MCGGGIYWLRLPSLADEPDVKIEGFDGNWYLNRPNVQLTCRADANPPVTIYQWKLWVCLNPRQKKKNPKEDEAARQQDVFLLKRGKAILQNSLIERRPLFYNICFKAYARKWSTKIKKKKHTPASLVLSRNVSLFICLFMKCVMKIRLGPEAEHNGPITAAAHTPDLPDGRRYRGDKRKQSSVCFAFGFVLFLLWSLRTSMQVEE